MGWLKNFREMLGETENAFIFAVLIRWIAWVAELVDALDSKSSSGNRVGVRFPPQVQGFEQRWRCRTKQRKPTSCLLEGGFSAFGALPQAVVETLRAMLRRQGKGEHAAGGAGHSPECSLSLTHPSRLCESEFRRHLGRIQNIWLRLTHASVRMF